MTHETNTEKQNTQEKQGSGRLLSLDALRGFDMFWITGGHPLVMSILAITGWPFLKTVAHQLNHCRWNGFHAEDLIFPLFVFMTGVTLGLSRKVFWKLDWPTRKKKYIHAVKRLILLIAICIVYNRACDWGNFLSWHGPRYAGVLTRIGITWFFCAMIVWHLRLRWQILIAAGILLGYWGLQKLCGGDNVANIWMDQHFLPGLKLDGKMDPEGILSTFPAIVTALLGAFAGKWITSNNGAYKKVLLLAAAGGAFLGIGWLWNMSMPVNKRLWSSSFVMVTGGWSCLLLAVFYLVIDVWNFKRLGWVWAVIGANAILIYISWTMVNWDYISTHVFAGILDWMPRLWKPFVISLGTIVLEWLILAWFYRKRIFIHI